MNKILILIFLCFTYVELVAQQRDFAVSDSITIFEYGKLVRIVSYLPVLDETIDPVLFSNPSLLLNSFDEEPLYSDSMMGDELYRFTWIPSFDYPYVITISRIGSDIKLEMKKGSKIKLNNSYLDLNKLSIEERILFKASERNLDTLKLIHLSEKARVKDTVAFEYRESIKDVKVEDWNSFIKLLSGKGFWGLDSKPMNLNSYGNDGADWILEAKTPKGYHYVYRWSPGKKENREFFWACRFLIKLAGTKKEKIH
jgi:hypothetical protein